MESAGQIVMDKIAAVVTLRLHSKMQHTELLEQLSMLEGIEYVEEI